VLFAFIPSFNKSEERVRKGAEKLQKFLNSKQQGRLDGFFTVKPKDNQEKPGPKGKAGKTDTKTKGNKRKAGSSSSRTSALSAESFCD